MNDILGILAIIILVILASFHINDKYKQYKKLKSYFKEELQKLELISPELYRHKNSVIAIDIKNALIVSICFNRPTELYTFKTEYILPCSTNKVILTFNETDYEFMIIISRENGGIVRRYHVLDIRDIEVIEEYEIIEQKEFITHIYMKIYVDDIETPYFLIDFLRFRVRVNSKNHFNIRDIAEESMEKIKILILRATKNNADNNRRDVVSTSNISFNISGNVYGSMMATQGAATMNNNIYINEIEKMIEVNGGKDKEELRIMVNEIIELLEEKKEIKKGILLKYSEQLEKHSWITGAIAQLTLGWLIGK
ncbi:hypothetical protein ACXFAU_01430 [Paenibacillus glucanolyticus]